MAMESVTIESRDLDGVLTLSALSGDDCLAEYKSTEVTARIVVTSLWREQFYRLIEFFEAMKKDWRGWDGVREWSSAEGEFAISATSDWLGHVLLQVAFKPVYPSWSVNVRLTLDVSQIDSLPQHLRLFFQQ